jgi:hypothetical protein
VEGSPPKSAGNEKVSTLRDEARRIAVNIAELPSY